MFEELGIGEIIDQATQQNLEMGLVTAGHAVKAMVLNGLGFVNQQLYLVPRFFQNKPTSRLITPGIAAEHLNDDALGRAAVMPKSLARSSISTFISYTSPTALPFWWPIVPFIVRTTSRSSPIPS
jgi:hypothetical protein